MNDLGYWVKRAQHALRLQIDQSLQKLDLTLPQYVALSHISEEAGISNAELARRAFVTPQTMHRVVQGLDKQGLINRAPHPDLERVQQLFLTQDGRQLLSKSRSLVERIETEAASQLDEDEIKMFRALLQKYLTGIEEAGAVL